VMSVPIRYRLFENKSTNQLSICGACITSQ
jgi:hypothetical protein